MWGCSAFGFGMFRGPGLRAFGAEDTSGTRLRAVEVWGFGLGGMSFRVEGLELRDLA